MKSRLIEFVCEEGTLLVEMESESISATGIRDSGAIRTGNDAHRGEDDSLQQKVVKSAMHFDSAIQVIKVVGDSVINKISQLGQKPDEISIKVGLKFTAEAGAIIAKTAAEGNLEVTLLWKTV